MKKYFLCLGLMFFEFLTYAQGLEGLIVEKYYVSNAADSAASKGILPVGSVTYRVFVDMLAGYKFQAVYGVNTPGAMHEFRIATTTSFFNNTDRGATYPNDISATNAKKNTVMLDSWFSVGATASGKMGILKTEDTDGSIGNSSSILQNENALAGIPVKTQDGMIAGTPEAPTFVGLGTALSVFDAKSQAGNLFSTNNGSVASLNGSVGPTAENKVLIGQFTTDGFFSFQLNIQIKTPAGKSENYVAKNPVGDEILMTDLLINNPPSISLTNPANNSYLLTGSVLAMEANATDADGVVTLVEFFDNGSTIVRDSIAPYKFDWTSVDGTHTFTAVVTDDSKARDTSASVTILVASSFAPTINIASPIDGASFKTGDVVSVLANASVIGSEITSVEFFMNDKLLVKDTDSPYQFDWTSVLGSARLIAVATDSKGKKALSDTVTISVKNNIAPKINIAYPVNAKSYITNSDIVIEANASDPDGTVSLVEFFINNIKVGDALAAPYQFTWTCLEGTKTLTAVVTDDNGTKTTSSKVAFSVKNNVPPTVKISSPINGKTITDTLITIKATATDPDGLVLAVEFFVNDMKVGQDTVAPFQYNWKPNPGAVNLTAIATDNSAGKTISPRITITAMKNVPPTVNITAPVSISLTTAPKVIVIKASASDVDGTIALVEFYVNNEFVGQDATPPYQYSWTSVEGIDTLTAVAIDNSGFRTTSPNLIITVGGTGIDDFDSPGSLFDLYPNPATDVLIIEIISPNPGSVNTYSIYDDKGNIVFHKELGKLTGTIMESIDISAFSKGAYIVELNIDGTSSNRQLIKN